MTEQDGNVGTVETQYYTIDNPAELTLESGEKFGPITLAYETYGNLTLKNQMQFWFCTPFLETPTPQGSTMETNSLDGGIQ